MRANIQWHKTWLRSPYYLLLNTSHNAKAYIDKPMEYLHPTPGSTMLDVACGKDHHTEQLANIETLFQSDHLKTIEVFEDYYFNPY